MSKIPNKGDIIICKNGHELYRIVEQISGSMPMLKPRYFERIDQRLPEPKTGQIAVFKCPECGENAYENRIGGRLLIKCGTKS